MNYNNKINNYYTYPIQGTKNNMKNRRQRQLILDFILTEVRDIKKSTIDAYIRRVDNLVNQLNEFDLYDTIDSLYALYKEAIKSWCVCKRKYFCFCKGRKQIKRLKKVILMLEAIGHWR